MNCETRYLLIVACSQRKRSDPYLLPAIERYDGGNFRVLRKAMQEGYWLQNIDVLVLSAKYGLIDASTFIADYDQRMNRERARELKTQTIQILQSYATRGRYREVYVELGQNYYFAVDGLSNLFQDSLIIYAEGRVGERQAQLKNWIVAKCKRR